MYYQKGIFLHVLDRELQESLAAPLSEAAILDLIRISLMSSKYIYVSYSHVCESSQIYPHVDSELYFLQEQGAVLFLLADEDIDSFFAKREKRYFKDRQRYPFYFSPNQIRALRPREACIPREGSSTEFIRQGLRALLREDVRVRLLPAAKDPQVLKVIERWLPQDPMQALTFHTFQRGFRDRKIFKRNEDSSSAQHNLKATLTSLHGKSIISETDSTIFTDIPGCRQYDTLGTDPYHSFPLYQALFHPLLGGKEILRNPEAYHKQLNEIVQFRQDAFFSYFSGTIYTLIQQIIGNNLGFYESIQSYHIWLTQLCDRIREIVYYAASGSVIDKLTVGTAQAYLDRLKTSLKEMFFRGGMNVRNIEPVPDRKVVLILTVNEEEHKAFLAELSHQNVSYTPVSRKSNVYFQAIYKNYTLMVLKCMPGSVGAASSTLSVQEAISDFNPAAVIACGVAFGCKPDKEKLGDIMVSKQVWQYDPRKKVGESNISRGDKVTASPILLQRFSSAIASWEEKNPDISVHVGLIASGEVLVNSRNFLKELKQSEPEIIGGEMEGSGVLSAAERENCNWIVVKAICDWAMNKKDDYQSQAAENAARYVLYVLDLFSL